MMLRLSILPLLLIALAFSVGGSVAAQEKEDSVPASTAATSDGIAIKLDISRRYLKNFLADEEALTPYLGPEESVRDLQGAFMMGSPQARFAAIWDPVACRLLGVLDLQAPPPPAKLEGKSEEEETDDSPDEPDEKSDDPEPSPYVMLAEGPPPLQNSAGAFGSPRYFGFRVVEGKPEFLYVHGGITVEERIWLEQGGDILKQRFSIREGEQAVTMLFPESWRKRVTADVGSWDDNTLSVSAEHSQDITLTYQLVEPTPDAKEEN